MTDKIRIEIDASNPKAEADLDKINKKLDQTEDSGKNAADGFSQAQAATISLNQGLELVGKFLDYAKQAFDETVGVAVAYAEQVRDLGRISGATAEETSKLIQVSDDLKVEYGTLEMAAKALAQKGLALTTEELAKASDEYLSFTDANDRAEYAVKKFGRSGLDMTKILEQGGDALRGMAAAQSGNLILSEAQLKKAREYEIAQDELNDTLEGFKVVVGNAVLPVLTEFIKGLGEALNGNEQLTASFKEQSSQLITQEMTFDEYIAAVKEAGYAVDEYGNLVALTGPHVDKLVGNLSDLELQFIELKEIQAGYTDGGRDYIAALKAQKAATGGFTEATEKEKAALDLVTQSMSAATVATLYQKAAQNMTAEAALALGVQLGLVSTSAYTMNKMMADLAEQLKTGKITQEEYNAKVAELLKLYNQLQDKTVTVTVKTKYVDEGNGTNRRWGGETGDLTGSDMTSAGVSTSGVSTKGTGSNMTVNVNGWQGDGVSLAAEIRRQQELVRLMS